MKVEPTRRQVIGAALAGSGAALLPGCNTPSFPGELGGADWQRGHLIREGKFPAPTGPVEDIGVLIAGGGVAGLATGWRLAEAGFADFILCELEDTPGGNARSGRNAVSAYPLGAHYLPVPNREARALRHMLRQFGMIVGEEEGAPVYDPLQLCADLEERLLWRGKWQEGLYPASALTPEDRAQRSRFDAAMAKFRSATGTDGKPAFALPMALSSTDPQYRALDRQSFAQWLVAQGYTSAPLRAYLRYCVRDDYGTEPEHVSAWAGIHYFAGRRGWAARGDGDRELTWPDVLTWPEGNGWLTRRLAHPLGDRLHTGQVVLRIEPMRQGVSVLVFNIATGQPERWLARHCIVALPVLVAARVVVNASPSVGQMLAQAAQHTRYAPWVVSNWHLSEPLHDAGGAAPAWDNVVCPVPQADPAARSGLGYVDATHQRLSPAPGPTVLTHYRALGDDPTARNALLFQPWTHWRDLTLAELAAAHPDLARKTTQVSVARYGHAMAMPVPDMMNQIGIYRMLLIDLLLSSSSALSFAHSDWAGYSVFEEAFTLGHLAGSGRAV